MIPKEVQKAMRRAKLPARFDALLGLTLGLFAESYWMQDNEVYEVGDEMDQAFLQLGGAWHKLLQESDEDLGIDPEHTRPGVIALLTKFEKKMKEAEYEDRPKDSPMKFPWKEGYEQKGFTKRVHANATDTGRRRKAFRGSWGPA